MKRSIADSPLYYLAIVGSILMLLIAASGKGEIIIHTSDGPANRPLPEVVQKMDAEQYAAWAEWQNTLARKYAENINGSERQYLQGYRTTTSLSTRSYSAAGSYGSRRLGETSRDSYGRRAGSMAGSSLTVPIRIPNPDRQIRSVVYYNPHCKPTPSVTHDTDGARIIDPYPNTVPDWDNLFGIVGGKIVSVNDVAESLLVPIPKERLYEQMLQPFAYTSVERVPIQ